MFAIAKAGFAGTVYLFGAATGVAVALPLAAVAFAPERSANPQHLAIQTQTVQVSQSGLVNRSAKGDRLDIRIPAVPMAAPALPAAPSQVAGEPQPVTGPAIIPVESRRIPVKPAGAAPTPLPRGCLSAMGGLPTKINTENLAVCMADISTLN